MILNDEEKVCTVSKKMGAMHCVGDQFRPIAS